MIQAVYTKSCYHQHVASEIKICWMVEGLSEAKSVMVIMGLVTQVFSYCFLTIAG